MERFPNSESERTPTVVCFEGISCCGKSVLMDALSSEEGITQVRIEIPRDLENPFPEFFLKNDAEKLKLAFKADGKLVLVDRGYLSTLVFYTVMSEIRENFDVWPLYKWYLENVGKNFQRPDYYFYVKIPSELSLARARGIRPFNENNVWLKSPDRALYWYERLFATMESSVPVITLDGTKAPGTLVCDARRELKDLLKI